MSDVMKRAAERGVTLSAMFYGVRSAQAQLWRDQLQPVTQSSSPHPHLIVNKNYDGDECSSLDN